MIRPESRRCLMSSAGREFRDNRWGDRLLLCSRGRTTFQPSARVIVTKKQRVFASRFTWRLLLRRIGSGEVAEFQVNIGVPLFAAVSSQNAAKKSPANGSES